MSTQSLQCIVNVNFDLATFFQGNVVARERERFISSHDIGCIFSYKLRYFRQTCGAYMVNTDLLPAAPQIVFLFSFFLVELLDSKSQLLEQILLSIMVFCLGGSHQSLKIFCFNLKKVLKIKKKFSIIIKTRYALRRCLTGTENRGNPARPSRRKLNSVFIIILIIITKKWRQNRSHNQRRGDGHKGYILCAYLQMVFDLREHSAKHYFCPGMPDKE